MKYYPSVCIGLILALMPLFSFGQESETARVDNIIQFLVDEMETRANQKVPKLLYECNGRYLGKHYSGKAYLRLKLLRNGPIRLNGMAPTPNTIKLNSTIPIRTENGRLSWIKELPFNKEWKEHKPFDSAFEILVETIITELDDGSYNAQSSGTYRWNTKPYIRIDLGVGRINIGLDEVAGPEIQKAVNKYIREMDIAIEKFLN